MNDVLLQKVKKFLEGHWVPGKPLLLGYSGGSDSKALLHLILGCRKFFPLELHVAHLDHGWRDESAHEAEKLREEATQLGVPFHSDRLSAPSSFHNLEAKGREARRQFFQGIYRKIGAQALLLAHQADDQAETVLKRIFEGAHLSSTGGIASVGEWEGMNVLRPLLSCQKKELTAWLEKRGFNWFEDPTNADPRFLRGRMRNSLLPILSEAFGKEITDNLCRLGRASQELSAYFTRKLSPYFSSVERGPWGVHWDLSVHTLETIEWEYLLREWLQREAVPVSSEALREIVFFLREKTPNRRFPLSRTLFVDRGHLFLASQELPGSIEKTPLKKGAFTLKGESGSWEAVVAEENSPFKATDWCGFWKGKITVCLPDGNYEIGSYSDCVDPKCRKAVSKHRQGGKVPSFLRLSGPLVFQNGIVVHDFLTGRKYFNFNSKPFNLISLVINFLNK